MANLTEEELAELIRDDSEATLEQLVDASVRVFGLLTEAIQDPTSPRSQRLLEMVNRLKERLETKAKSALAEAGMTEEELKTFLENPDNFSPSEWEQLQGMRREMGDASRQFMENAMQTASGQAALPGAAPGEEKGQEAQGSSGKRRPGHWIDA